VADLFSRDRSHELRAATCSIYRFAVLLCLPVAAKFTNMRSTMQQMEESPTERVRELAQTGPEAHHPVTKGGEAFVVGGRHLVESLKDEIVGVGRKLWNGNT